MEITRYMIEAENPPSSKYRVVGNDGTVKVFDSVQEAVEYKFKKDK